ncbi:MAG: S-methyl-5-thioribose-1-phosphate isomerase [Bacteroidota bacterium]
MKIQGTHYQSIWLAADDPRFVEIIDQRQLPHQFVVERIGSHEQMATAIKDMHLRGAPLIGAAAAFGMYLAALECPEELFPAFLNRAAEKLFHTRPTAVDLQWALGLQQAITKQANSLAQAREQLLHNAQKIIAQSAENCRMIGQHGLPLIRELSEKKQGKTVHILTHCNAGWLACVDYGTATAPIYAAHDEGLDVHVWVDETRPRNQGARLTAWELGQHGIPHTVIADNTGGHLMQHAMVDMVITGTDRTTRQGDVANKIGTYLKALAAYDNQIPFYVALPSSTIDWEIEDGLRDIPIEERAAEEVTHIQGWVDGQIQKVRLSPADSPAKNYGFDVTPARLVTALITERGHCNASEDGLTTLFPERKTSK